MKNTTNIFAQQPFMLFWLGVVTGAVVILSILMFRMYGEDYQAAILKMPSVKKAQVVAPVTQKKKPAAKYNPAGTVPDTGPSIR